MRRVSIAIWAALIAGALALFLVDRDLVGRQIHGVLGGPALAAAAIYLALGALRGFTLIPSTYLVIAAVAFFPPWPLLGLTLAGILISSASIYWCADALRLGDVFSRRHAATIARLRDVLARHELPIIIGWSFFPLAPTDLIVYVCGALRIDARKCLLGVCVGEGAICAVYIFFGDYLLRMWEMR